MLERHSVSALILSGGRSRRMGCDKALIKLEGEYLIQRIVRWFKPRFDEILVLSGRTKRYEKLLDVPVLPDLVKHKGPLGGLYTGLKSCRYDWALLIACDMPFVRPEIIELLVGEIGTEPIVAFEIGGYRTHTLTLYHKSCLPLIEQQIRANDLALHRLFKRVPVKLISERRARQADPELLSFRNLNRPEDLIEVRRRA